MSKTSIGIVGAGAIGRMHAGQRSRSYTHRLGRIPECSADFTAQHAADEHASDVATRTKLSYRQELLVNAS